MQIVINEQLKNKLSSEEQEAKLRKTQLNSSNGGSPSSGKNRLTANLIATSTLNRNKERFFRLFNMSNSKTSSKPNGTSSEKTKPTSNHSSTNNAAKTSASSTTKSNGNSKTTTTNRTERTAKTNGFIGRSKSVNSTNKANSISTISGNKPVNVSS